MHDPIRKALAEAFARLFRPLSRILIRNGIPFAALADWAKKVYVDVAFEEFGEAGKKQTVSRVSALTGMSRKEVKRLRELDPDADIEAGDRYNRAVRVISGWLNDKTFLAPDGEPAELAMDGDEPSFAALVRAYSGDVTPRAMLSVLQAAGSVEASDDGSLRLVRHVFIPGNDPTEKLHILGTDAGELIATIDHNLTSGPDTPLFQRKVSNTRLNPADTAEFRALSADRAQALLEELDAWLSRHEIEPDEPDQAAQYVSLGIYYSEGKDSQEEDA
jgi:hypothetical protein